MIYIDSSKIKEIKKYYNLGIIRGVTTNPTIMVHDGIRDFEKQSLSIAKLVSPFPVSVEVLSNDKDEMLRDALLYSDLCENIVVKIPIHGPTGELDNLRIIHMLEQNGVRVNATVCMNAQQALLASLSGASYVSLFGGRINNMGYNCIGEISRLRGILDRHKLDSKMIIGSVREVLNVVEWLSVGADIVTVPPDILGKMIIHPYTKETVAMFLSDAEKLVRLKEKVKH